MVRLSALLRDPLILKRAVSPVLTHWWKNVPEGPPDVILGIFESFKVDQNPNKVDLSVGAYRDELGKPYVLRSILKAEQNLVDKKLSKESDDDDFIGSEYYRDVTYRLAVGEKLFNRPHVSVQSVSGSGSIRIAAETIGRIYKGKKVIYIPNPSWNYHAPMFKQSGVATEFYRYHDARNHELDWTGMITDLTHMPNDAIILFQMVGHNPTATDPTIEQWKEMSYVLKNRNILIFFDMAYQGFGSGCFETDAFPVRHFIEEGHQVVFAQSYSKIMGLYSVRVGAVTFMVNSEEEKTSILDQLKHYALCMYGQPPVHGSRVVEEIFHSPELKSEWEEELRMMHTRIHNMRQLLTKKLHDTGTSRDWKHLLMQKGMFFYSGLSVEQCEKLINDHSVYVIRNGRIAVPGINEQNVDYVAHCLHQVTK